jgi:hypothetical protein
LKEVAPLNMKDYVMNKKVTKQMSVMEEKEINCTDYFNVHMMKL